jgi:GT2 family glycosyltransferase
MSTLHVSIVVYHSDAAWLSRTLHSVLRAAQKAIAERVLSRVQIALVDNAASQATMRSAVGTLIDALRLGEGVTVALHDAPRNLGFGGGNNLALHDSRADYVLVMNPDVDISDDAFAASIAHLLREPQCAMVVPVVSFPDGRPQYLVKREPRALTLALRGFAPAFIQRLFMKRLNDYEFRDLAFDAPITGCRIVSGSWMFMRGDAWRRSGGFDERFFLYFEDYDLSARIAAFARIDRIASCRIVHAGGNAAGKGRAHIGMFVRSAIRFFAKHGWRW